MEELEDMIASLGGITALTTALGGLLSATNQGRDALGRFQAATSPVSDALKGVGAGADKVAAGISAMGAGISAVMSGSIPSAQQAMNALGDTLSNGITNAASAAAGALSKLGPEGEAAGAAIEGLGAVASATVGTLTSLMGTAIEVTEKVDLLRDSFAGLAGGAAAGAALQASIAGLNLPFAADQVNRWAASLSEAGVKGAQLSSEMKAIASAEALTKAFGGGGGAAAEKFFKSMGNGGKEADELLKKIQQGGRRGAEQIKAMGLNIEDLGGQAAVAKMTAQQLNDAVAKALQKKGAGPLDDIANSMGNILTKAQEGLRSLFSGLEGPIKPFMAAVKSLFGEFNKGGAATNGLKPIITGLFTTLFSWATKAIGVIHEVIKSLEGKGKPGMLNTIVTTLKAIFTNATVLHGIKAIFTVIAVVIGVVVAVVATLATIFAVVAAGVVAAAGQIIDGVSALGGMISAGVGEAVDALSGLASGALDAASNFVSGLVDGITAGAGAVAAAVSGLASGALSAFTGALGIHSPSTIMLEHGEDNIAGAAATGVDKGAPKMAKSMAKLGGGKASKGASPGSGSGPTFTFNNCNFGGADEGSLRSMLERVWEEMAAEAGAQPEPP